MQKKEAQWITVKETAEKLKCSTYRVYNSMEKLPHKKVGSTYFINSQELDNLFQNQSIDAVLPGRGSWHHLTRYLMNHAEDESIIITISEIRAITESTSAVLYMPDEWIFQGSKSKSGAYKAVRLAGFDITNMKFSHNQDYGGNVITEITFEKNTHVQDAKMRRDTNKGATVAEQRGLIVPSHKRVFVNFDPAITRVHLDKCYYVQDFISGKELPEKWQEHATLEEAEDACLEKKGENWQHCLTCFKKGL